MKSQKNAKPTIKNLEKPTRDVKQINLNGKNRENCHNGITLLNCDVSATKKNIPMKLDQNLEFCNLIKQFYT